MSQGAMAQPHVAQPVLRMQGVQQHRICDVILRINLQHRLDLLAILMPLQWQRLT